MSASPKTEADKFDSVLDSVLQQLHTLDTNKVATTCAALAMLVSQAPSSAQNLSAKVMPEATRLLHTEHTLVQQNACAVIMTLAETQAQQLSSKLQAWAEAVDWISAKLADTAEPIDLRVNCAEALGAVASANQDGYEALISTLHQDDAILQEAAADAQCKIATLKQNRQHLVDKGALQGLAVALQSSKHEVQVRSLLALGMLVGDNSEWQIQLADVPQALPRLLALRLQHNDADVQSIADGIVGTLLKNAGCKQQLSTSFRAQQNNQHAQGQYI